MSDLLHYLATGEGADLVLVCEGEHFLVHKEVICDNSPILKRAMESSKSEMASQRYNVEWCTSDVLGHILTFMYRGPVPDWLEQHLELDTETVAAKATSCLFAMCGRGRASAPKALSMRKCGPTPKLTDGEAESVRKNQTDFVKPYNVLACADHFEVVLESNIFAVATGFDILPLKKVSLRKISTWVNNSLQSSGVSATEEFYPTIDSLLQSDTVIIDSVLHVCTEHISVVRNDSKLVDIIEKLFPWVAAGIKDASTGPGELAACQADLERLKKTQVGMEVCLATVESKLARAEDRACQAEDAASQAQAQTKMAEALVDRIEHLYKNSVQQLVDEKVISAKSKDNHQSTNLQHPPPYDGSLRGLGSRVQARDDSLSQTNAALSEAKAEYQEGKAALQRKIDGMWANGGKIRNAFKQMSQEITNSGKCGKCGRYWNVLIGHKNFTSMCTTCKGCKDKKWFDGAVHQWQ